MFLLDKQSIY